MLVTEQDAVMKKWCPMIRLRWEARPFAFNRSNPGRSARFRNMMYRIFFPRLHHEMSSLRSDVYRALRGAGPGAEISTLLGQAAGRCHIMGRSAAESPQLSRGK